MDVDYLLGDYLRELGEYRLTGIVYEKNAGNLRGSHDSYASQQYLDAAAAFERAGLREDMTRCLDSAHRIEGDKALAKWWNRHAIEMRRHGRFEQAAEFYQKQAELELGTSPIWTYNIAADMFGRAEKYTRAAEALERAATSARAGQIPTWPFLDRAVHLYLRGSAADRAAALFDQCGRKARAERARGNRIFDLKEAERLPQSLGLCSIEDSRRAFGEIKLDNCKAAEEAYRKGDLTGAVSAWKAELWDSDHLLWSYEHWYWIPELYLQAGDRPGYRRALREVGTYFRSIGWWYLAAEMYLYIQDDLYDEFDRVCIEEDELEVAALWYEQAKMPERAAKIYDLMGQSGKSSKAQSEGSREKPQDAAKPKSDSGEESDRSDFDQLVLK